MNRNRKSLHYIILITVLTIGVIAMLLSAVYCGIHKDWLRFGFMLFCCLIEINGIVVMEVYFKLKHRLTKLENTMKGCKEQEKS